MHGLDTAWCAICNAKAPSRRSGPPPSTKRSDSWSNLGVADRRLCKECGVALGTTDTSRLCSTCLQRAKLRARRRARQISIPAVRSWEPRFDVRDWQRRALGEWERAGRRGVIEAATGTGKTAVALSAIASLHELYGDRLRVAIVVPTKVLAAQWRDQLQRNLGILRTMIGEQHSDASVDWNPQHSILITVVNSARQHLVGVLDNWRGGGNQALLVVDECHRAGSEHNSQIFQGHYDFSLGLSATPERPDRGHEEFIYPGLGRPVYRYPLLDALDDGALAPVKSVNLYVDFDAQEQLDWENLSIDIGKAFRSLKAQRPELEDIEDEYLLREVTKLAKHKDPLALKILGLLSTRRELLSSAQARLQCQRAVLDWLVASAKRALVFHEVIKSAEQSHRYLTGELGIRAGLDHSQLPRLDRAAAMENFQKERHQVLVAVRALDEGVDVPDVSVAVITAGSRSRRQRIQRFGRVLRPAEGKEALVLTILVRGTPEEVAVGGRDADLLGRTRVRHHRWPGADVASATGSGQSTYAPQGAKVTDEAGDLLTALDLGLSARWGTASNRVSRARSSGGYSARETQYSPNAWHQVEQVREGIGIPSDVFDRLRRDIRRAYWHRLDPAKRTDRAVIYGQEIDAIRRTWRTRGERRSR